MFLVQVLQEQLSVLQATVQPQLQPNFALKSEPIFCSDSELLRQRAALLAAEDASITAATECVHMWTLQQHEQLKAIHDELPLAGTIRFSSCLRTLTHSKVTLLQLYFTLLASTSVLLQQPLIWMSSLRLWGG
jgi:hypothetical protein